MRQEESMEGSSKLIQENIMRNMAEGVMSIGFNGVINYVNPIAVTTLGLPEDCVGKKFAECFFDSIDNDEFTQMVLDAVYDRTRSHEGIVPYIRGDITLQLRVVTSFLQEKGEKVGIIVVFSDLSELMDLRDAVKSMEKIRALNSQLELRNNLLSETFGRFLSDDIVRQLLDTPDGLMLGGKKKELTVMMSDLRGFTAMSERMDPEDLITMLNHYLGEMTDAIQSKEGTIIEFMGDGIFAIFGAPLDNESHAADAVAAALDMQSRMEAINKWNIERDYPILEMGIGINTGEVIVGNIGSEKRTKYGVVGSNVNLTGRVESYTINGQILISGSTKESILSDMSIAKEIVVHPKGVKGDMKLYQVVGIGEPYNLFIDVKSTLPDKLEKTIPVTFYIVEGKHGEKKSHYGGITALGQDMAVIETEAELNVYDNMQLEAGGELYCKVMEKNDSGYLIHFTSVPSGYKQWKEYFVGK
jgi:adenylate cyclase